MRVLKFTSLAPLLLGVTLLGALPAVAQLREDTPAEGSTIDRDASQRSVLAVDDPVPDATTEPTTGTLEVIFKISVKSSFPSGSKLYCLVEAIAISDASTAGHSAVETNVESQTLNSAAPSCTVTIPYSWQTLPSSSKPQDVFDVGYVVGVENGKGTSAAALRSSSGTVIRTKTFPANGAITKYEVVIVL
jgi:hypothetical protein